MNVRLRFRGAAHAVTGSCYEIETGQARILVDCGLFQGSKSERELNYGAFPFLPSTKIKQPDAVALGCAAVLGTVLGTIAAMMVGWSLWPMFWTVLGFGAHLAWLRWGTEPLKDLMAKWKR